MFADDTTAIIHYTELCPKTEQMNLVEFTTNQCRERPLRITIDGINHINNLTKILNSVCFNMSCPTHMCNMLTILELYREREKYLLVFVRAQYGGLLKITRHFQL